jgi:hypothetical protein
MPPLLALLGRLRGPSRKSAATRRRTTVAASPGAAGRCPARSRANQELSRFQYVYERDHPVRPSKDMPDLVESALETLAERLAEDMKTAR